jgi:hypothetical protein
VNRAGATLGDTAAIFRPGQFLEIPDDPEQRRLGIAVERALFSIESECHHVEASLRRSRPWVGSKISVRWRQAGDDAAWGEVVREGSYNDGHQAIQKNVTRGMAAFGISFFPRKI